MGEQPVARAPKPERTQHIYGGTLGGPIVKNKLFFFGNYQGTRFDAPGSETISVAPEAWRRGDLSSVTATIQRSRRPARSFPGNQIPVGRISPIAARDPQQHRRCTRCRTGRSRGVTGNYVGETLTTNRANQGDVRVDWNTSTKDKVFGRFSFAEYEADERQAGDAAAAGQPDRRAVSQRGGQLEPRREARRSSTRYWSASTRSRSSAATTRLGRDRERQRDVRDRRRAADCRAELDRLGRRPDRRSAPARATRTRSTGPIRSTRSSPG